MSSGFGKVVLFWGLLGIASANFACKASLQANFGKSDSDKGSPPATPGSTPPPEVAGPAPSSSADPSPIPSATPTLAAPASLTMSVVANTIVLSWSGVDGATAYKVRRAHQEASASEIATVTTTTYTDENVHAGVTYTYEVLATNSATTSPPVSVSQAVITPPAFNVTGPSGALTPLHTLGLSWEASPIAIDYRVVVAKDSQCSVKVIDVGGVMGTSFSFEGFRDGATYYPCIYANTGHHVYGAANNGNLAFTVSIPVIVLGQTATNLNTDASPETASTIHTPTYAMRFNNSIAVSDNQNRLLIWNSFPGAHNDPASLVLGQSTFAGITADPGGVSASTLDYPYGITYHEGKLFIADSENNRIVVHDSIPTGNFAAASWVLGKPDFSTFAALQGAAGLRDPRAIVIHEGKFYVADSYNHRILIWNTVPSATATPADLVLGQADFNGGAVNAGSVTGSDSKSFDTPAGIAFYQGKMIVADRSNHRVLIWNTIPTTNFAPADIVLGQADMASSSANRGGAVGADTLNTPMGVAICGGRLTVPDRSNHRILIWDEFPTSNGEPADRVLGQPDLISNTANNGGISWQSLNQPYPLTCDANRMYIADGANHRVIIRSIID